METRLEIVGRSSSHYTRTVRIVAHELDLPYRLTPILDLMSDDRQNFAGNPALKLPILRADGELIYGSVNICRVLARMPGHGKRVFLPEHAQTPLHLNAHEILSHAMTAQVEVVLHEVVEKRPPDTASKKRRKSLINCLVWLDDNIVRIRETLPAHDISFLEAGLFSLVAHIPFRNPIDLPEMPDLHAFEADFGRRASARATPYQFDGA